MIEYRTIDDKESWGAGPWVDEPDKLQWKDPATGLPCLAVRHGRYGHWCGYVGVAEGHPAFERGYDEVDIDVHGGLTYADHCADGPEEHAICHIPEPGEPDHVWWFGFDCSHAWDYSPGFANGLRRMGIADPQLECLAEGMGPYPGSSYRTLEYVRAETTELAAQLAALA